MSPPRPLCHRLVPNHSRRGAACASTPLRAPAERGKVPTSSCSSTQPPARALPWRLWFDFGSQLTKACQEGNTTQRRSPQYSLLYILTSQFKNKSLLFFAGPLIGAGAVTLLVYNAKQFCLVDMRPSPSPAVLPCPFWDVLPAALTRAKAAGEDAATGGNSRATAYFTI